MNQPDTLSLAGTAGAGAKRWRPTVPISPRRSRSLASRSLLRSGRTSARSQRHHRRTGGTHATIQLPPLEPLRIRSARKVVPVVTTPKGGDRPAAYGPRVGGPDPADTPTNGGYRRAAPPWNLLFDDGQRPTIHRPQRCRRPNGHRASVTPDRTTETFHGLGGYKRGWGGRASPFPHARPDERVPLATRHSETTCLAGKFTTDIAWWARVWANVRVSEVDSGGTGFIWEVRHSAKGAWPTGDPTDPRFSPAPRRAVTPVSPGATANWPTGRSVEHRKRRPTVSPSAKANGRLAGVYLRDLAPDARRRNPQVPAPNAGPPPRGSANPSTFAPNWYPCRLALRPCSTADPPGWARCRANVPVSGVDPGGHRPAIQSGPVPRPAVPMSDGPTGLLIAEPRRRGPPCRAVIAQDRRQLTVDWSLLRSRGPWPTGAHVGWATGVPIEQALHSLGTATPCASPMPARQLAIRPGRSSAPWPTLWPSPCRMGQLACPVREGVGHHRDPAVPGGPPSKRPALPDPLVGGVVHKSSQGRADAQRLVATRLLDRLHDPLGHFSPSSPGLLPGSRRQPAEVRGPEAYSYPTTTCGATSPRSGTDSDLEAFSHYPADGSVAALPGQTAAKTNYLNQRFLSY
ncbi:hypothetical protein OAory_01072880 [Aspergillus oryzae]|uniref:Uncharacterized protein n=1 Tax=Aspergillus oryzae TaxID=5062 RepID=A0A1S9D468_ASPOZ|nr:hypothetical protein OAory_01022740 [Aspergillus oryzae]OOO03865.1 hypothetical protein OAory_01053500 [Aspergillus oryzae]OOO03866.1 hypothetical protein OAory_01053510 [Aspergillus oryzae]OOO03869.1 hypothetical protein OAory_01072870 [Aspergillus oryzae]OOO03870.1 hypothetical protein OAory_01072880 [Aspergillus oryzae]